jgi:hypothetical protein
VGLAVVRRNPIVDPDWKHRFDDLRQLQVEGMQL